MNRVVTGKVILALSMYTFVGSGSLSAQPYNWTARAGFAPQTAIGGEPPKHTLAPGLLVSLSRRFGERIDLRVDVSVAKMYSDSTASSSFAFGSDSENRVSALLSRRALLSLQYSPASQHSLSPYLGLGAGVDLWRALTPEGDTVLDTLGLNNTRASFKTSELIVGGYGGVQARLGRQIGMALEARADYHTGAGAEFAQIVNETRPRWTVTFAASITFAFGSTTRQERWNSDGSWTETTGVPRSVGAERDSDADGVPDRVDRCAATPRGVEVNSQGCPLDSDGDGVFDGLDDCPETPAAALALVDIYGCPIDSDFDGVPDFVDRCADGPVGAVVGVDGCPLDGDGDGVPDGLDDCPGTVGGMLVDDFGCPDVSVFATPLVLNINYASGSYELDNVARQRLTQIVPLLQSAPAVTLTVYGYTDNIGPAEANRTLSQKRANRVRDFLVQQGIDPGRIVARGRGETNFIADNATNEGRQRNRRIEIVFEGN